MISIRRLETGEGELYRRIRLAALRDAPSAFDDVDLAYIHHAGFTDLARSAGEVTLARLRADGIDSGTVGDRRRACAARVPEPITDRKEPIR